MWETPELPFPATSRDRIAEIQKNGRRLAVERAQKSKFFAGRLNHVNLKHVHEPDEWAKIPLLTKDQLRQISAEDFQDVFCIRPRTDIIEFWRSGGSTGQPFSTREQKMISDSPAKVFDAPGKRLESRRASWLMFPSRWEFIPLDRSIAERHSKWGLASTGAELVILPPPRFRLTSSAH